MMAMTWPQEPTESARPATPWSESRDPSWAVPGGVYWEASLALGTPAPLPTPGSVPDQTWSEPQCDLGQMRGSVGGYHLHCAHHGVLQV